jgi:hypothetical protein
VTQGARVTVLLVALEIEADANLDLALRGQSIAGRRWNKEWARRRIARYCGVLEGKAGRSRRAINSSILKSARRLDREHLRVCAGDVHMIEEIERVSAERQLPGFPDFELARDSQVDVNGPGQLE